MIRRLVIALLLMTWAVFLAGCESEEGRLDSVIKARFAKQNIATPAPYIYNIEFDGTTFSTQIHWEPMPQGNYHVRSIEGTPYRYWMDGKGRSMNFAVDGRKWWVNCIDLDLKNPDPESMLRFSDILVYTLSDAYLRTPPAADEKRRQQGVEAAKNRVCLVGTEKYESLGTGVFDHVTGTISIGGVEVPRDKLWAMFPPELVVTISEAEPDSTQPLVLLTPNPPLDRPVDSLTTGTLPITSANVTLVYAGATDTLPVVAKTHAARLELRVYDSGSEMHVITKGLAPEMMGAMVLDENGNYIGRVALLTQEEGREMEGMLSGPR